MRITRRRIMQKWRAGLAAFVFGCASVADWRKNAIQSITSSQQAGTRGRAHRTQGSTHRRS